MFGISTNLFRFIGDALMFSSRAVMYRKILSTKSVSGISLKTHLLYFLTYILRYLDLFHSYSYTRPLYIYNSICKFAFIGYQVVILYTMFVKYRHSYSRRFDSFPVSVLIGVSIVFGVFINFMSSDYSFEETCYTISLIMESIAILPQLVMTQEDGSCENMTASYIILLGLYRLNYLIFFIAKKLEGSRVDTLVIVTAIIQTGLYMDFFIVYFKMYFKKENKLDL